MKKNFDMSGIQPKLREILEELDGRIGCRNETGRSGKDAAAAPTQEEFNALLKSLRDAGIIAK